MYWLYIIIPRGQSLEADQRDDQFFAITGDY